MRARREQLLVFSGVALALVWLTPTPASADVASADQLFGQAKTLMAEGKFAEACAKFEASYEADAALGALLNLADCLEKDGRLATAYGRWGDALDIATRKGDERAVFAKERREAIRPSLSFVTLEVRGDDAGFEVWKGDTRLAKGAFGAALPTNPGETVIQVVRDDQVLWEAKLSLKQAEQRVIAVPLDEIAKANPAPVRKRQALGETKVDVVAKKPVGFWNDQRIAGFVVGGVGVLGLGAGFTLGGLTMAKSGQVDAECTPGDTAYCTPHGLAVVDEATTLGLASMWTLIGSGVVTGVGITVIVTAPGEAAELDERAGVEPYLRLGPGRVELGGTFE